MTATVIFLPQISISSVSSAWMAPSGHASAHLPQRSQTEPSIIGVGSSTASVTIIWKRWRDPNFLENGMRLNDSSHSPQATAA